MVSTPCILVALSVGISVGSDGESSGVGRDCIDCRLEDRGGIESESGDAAKIDGRDAVESLARNFRKVSDR
jgi:hypothetical protein